MKLHPILDKTDKIGVDGVINELKKKNISDTAIDQLNFFLDLKGPNQNKINDLRIKFSSNNISTDGLDILEQVINASQKFNLKNIDLSFDLSLS
jgi:histidyl-tRNA synthetase